jgi:hypothetical protein
MYRNQRLIALILLAVSLCSGFVPSRPIAQRGVRVKSNQFTSFPGTSSSYDHSTTSTLSAASSSHEGPKSNSKLDSVLSRLTSAFPFFVLGSAILGLSKPSTLMWTNRGTLISWMLASVMCATGLSLEKKDFANVINKDLAAVPAGVLCQVS